MIAAAFAKKYWRELLILVLALSLAGAVGVQKQTSKKLAEVTKLHTEAVTTLAEAQSVLTSQETRTMQAEDQVHILTERLQVAQSTTKKSTPVLLANGKVAYQTDEESNSTSDSTSEDRSIMELRLQRESKLREDAELRVEEQRQLLQDEMQTVKMLESSGPAFKHWLVSGSMISGGPASGTWVGGLGWQMNLGAWGLGVMGQVPVAGGPAGGPASLPLNERPWTGGLTASF